MRWLLVVFGACVDEPSTGGVRSLATPTDTLDTGSDTGTGAASCPWAGDYGLTVYRSEVVLAEEFTGSASLSSNGVGCLVDLEVHLMFEESAYPDDPVTCVTVFTERIEIHPDGYVWAASTAGRVSDNGATIANPVECDGEHAGDSEPGGMDPITVTEDGGSVWLGGVRPHSIAFIYGAEAVFELELTP